MNCWFVTDGQACIMNTRTNKETLEKSDSVDKNDHALLICYQTNMRGTEMLTIQLSPLYQINYRNTKLPFKKLFFWCNRMLSECRWKSFQVVDKP